jgi:hypothetical protein
VAKEHKVKDDGGMQDIAISEFAKECLSRNDFLFASVHILIAATTRLKKTIGTCTAADARDRACVNLACRRMRRPFEGLSDATLSNVDELLTVHHFCREGKSPIKTL